MRIIAARITLDFHGNLDLAEKRRQISDLCEEVRRKFNLSACEIDAFDDLERCVIGLAGVVPDTWRERAVQSFLEKILAEVDSTAFARVVSEQSEITAI
jgi:uncharacterized protein YlxP (DUF503 family)